MWFRYKFLCLILGLGFLFASTSAQAQEEQPTEESVELYRLPEGRRCSFEQETYQCFNLSEYKLMLEMDTDLEFFVKAYQQSQTKIDKLEQKVQQLTIALEASTSELNLVVEDRARYFDMWKEENKKRYEAEYEPNLGTWLGWGLAAGEAMTILGLVLAMVL